MCNTREHNMYKVYASVMILVSRAAQPGVCRGGGCLPSKRRRVPHRTAPHRTALHRIALHCTAPHYTARHRTALAKLLESISVCWVDVSLKPPFPPSSPRPRFPPPSRRARRLRDATSVSFGFLRVVCVTNNHDTRACARFIPSASRCCMRGSSSSTATVSTLSRRLETACRPSDDWGTRR